MRLIAALLLVAAGSSFSYWAFLATFVWDSGSLTQWVFLTAFGWLMCHDIWRRFFAPPKRRGRGTSNGAPEGAGLAQGASRYRPT